MEIEKAYFTLPEILDRWSISEADLIYLAENDKLRLSVRVFGVPFELGDYEETHEGGHFRVPTEQSYYSGLLELPGIVDEVITMAEPRCRYRAIPGFRASGRAGSP